MFRQIHFHYLLLLQIMFLLDMQVQDIKQEHYLQQEEVVEVDLSEHMQLLQQNTYKQ